MSFTGAVESGDADPSFKVSIRLRTFPTNVVKDDDEEDNQPEAEVKIVYVEVEEEFVRNRKEQFALTALIGTGMIGILLGVILNCCMGKKPESAKRKKVQQASQFNEIEITSKAFDSEKMGKTPDGG